MCPFPINRLQIIKDSIQVLPLIGIAIVAFVNLVYFLLRGVSNTQIVEEILLLFIASTSLYLISLSYKVNYFLRNTEVKEILKEMSELKIILNLFDTSISISEPGFLHYKDKIIHDALVELETLRNQGHTGMLTIREGHNWSVPMLEKLKGKDYVKAVSFLAKESGEWENSSAPTWRLFLKANETAAHNCAFVKRIFIVDLEALDHFFRDEQDNIVKKHTPVRFNETKLTGIFINKRKLGSIYPELLEEVNNRGFTLISSEDTKMAILDIFKDVDYYDRKYKVQITYNAIELEELERNFDNILRLPSPIIIDLNTLETYRAYVKTL